MTDLSFDEAMQDMEDQVMIEMKAWIKNSKSNIICFNEMKRTHPGKILNLCRKYIKKTVKKRVHLYKPLELKAIYHELLKFLQDDDFKVLREIPPVDSIEGYLDDLIKNFLIERAYFALEEEQYIRRVIKNKMSNSTVNEIGYHEAVDYITERLEKDNLRKLKNFKEKSQFKTFMIILINHLFIDSRRKWKIVEEKETYYGLEIEKQVTATIDEPLIQLIKLEEEEAKIKAIKLIPEIIMETLNCDEKMVIKMKYEKGMSINVISKDLKLSYPKAKKFIQSTEKKLSEEVLSRIKKQGGSNETY
jgi:DNA-directed RNA polymerase specialized sigma24 family protein